MITLSVPKIDYVVCERPLTAKQGLLLLFLLADPQLLNQM